jgi:hypothetical protein
LNRTFLGDANSIGSDLPFMALFYLTIYAVQKAYDTASADPPRLGYLLLASVLICISYCTRTVGIVLLPSLLLYEGFRYRRVTRSAVLVVLMFVAAAAAQRLFLHSDASYLDQYNVGPSVFLNNGIAYVAQFAGFWHNGYSKAVGGLLFLTITAFAALGYVSSARRQVTFLEILPVLYVVVVLLFPGYAGKRYLQPIFPLYLLFVARGLHHAWLIQRARLRRAVVVVLTAAVAASYAASFTRLDLDVTEGISRPDSIAMFEYVVNNTDDDDVMVFIKPRVMALLTSRSSSVYHMPEQDSQLWEYFESIGATHLVVVENDRAFAGAEDPSRVRYLHDFAGRNTAKLTPVFANADFRVLRIVGSKASPSALTGGA